MNCADAQALRRPGRQHRRGQTTAAKLLSTRFGYEPFDEPVIDNRFLRDYYADMKRWSFTLPLEFLVKRAQHHELIHTVPKSCIQDRTLLEDPEIFAKDLHWLGHMDDRELDLYLEYFQRLNRDLHQPDKAIYLECNDTGVLARRIRERGRVEEAAITDSSSTASAPTTARSRRSRPESTSSTSSRWTSRVSTSATRRARAIPSPAWSSSSRAE